MNQIDGAKIVAIQGIGTSEGDAEGYVEVVLHDGSQRALVFEESIGNPLAIAFMAAASHLEAKRSARRAPENTEIIGQPVRVITAQCYLGQRGPARVMILELTTEPGATLRFEMPLRAADALSKRLQKRGRAQAPLPKGDIH